VGAGQAGGEIEISLLRASRATVRSRRKRNAERRVDRSWSGEQPIDAPRTEEFPICPSANENVAPSRVDIRRPAFAIVADAKQRANGRAGFPLYFAQRQRRADSGLRRLARSNATSVPPIRKNVTTGKALATSLCGPSLSGGRVGTWSERPGDPSRQAKISRSRQSPQSRPARRQSLHRLKTIRARQIDVLFALFGAAHVSKRVIERTNSAGPFSLRAAISIKRRQRD